MYLKIFDRIIWSAGSIRNILVLIIYLSIMFLTFKLAERSSVKNLKQTGEASISR
jgi:hypothetical protein